MARLINKTQGFTIVSNNVLRNKELSIKERGLLITLLSLPNNWEFSVLGLTKILPDGKDAISSTLRKLEEQGYLRRIQTKGKDGRFIGYDWEISDTQLAEKPYTEKPSTDKPLTEIPTQYNTNQSIKKKVNTNTINTNLILSEVEKTRYDLTMITGIEYLFETEENALDRDIFEIMVEVCASNAAYYKISGQTVPTSILQSRIRKMSYEHVRAIREAIESVTTPIRNIKNYILKCLYDSPNTINTLYANKVAVDLSQ